MAKRAAREDDGTDDEAADSLTDGDLRGQQDSSSTPASQRLPPTPPVRSRLPLPLKPQGHASEEADDRGRLKSEEEEEDDDDDFATLVVSAEQSA